MRWMATTFMLPLAVLVGGCSSGNSGGTSSGTTSKGATGTSSSGATTTGGTATAGTGGQPYSGSVSLSKAAGQGGPYGNSQNSANATFVAGPAAGAPACAGSPSGACCFTPAASPSSGGSLPAVSAGAIALVDNGVSLGALSYNAGTQTYSTLTTISDQRLAWAAGDTLRIHSSGSTVHKFDGTMVAPAALAGLVPALAPSVTGPLPVGQDFVVSWTPAGATQLNLLVSDYGVGDVTCSAPDSAGTLTLPAALLTQFSAGDKGSITASRIAFGAPDAGPDNASVIYQMTNSISASVSFGTTACAPQGWSCGSAVTCCASLQCVQGSCH